MQVFADVFRGRVIKAEVIMKAARPVYDIAVKTVQFVASHDKQLFPARGTVEQAQQRCLIVIIVAGTESLIEFIEKNHTFLMDGFQKSRKARAAGIHQDHRITLANGGFTNHFCE